MRIILICLIISLNSYSQSLTCIAGTGHGDGLLASGQSITPSTHFVDSIGNIYFTDLNYSFNGYYNSVRKINTLGLISTFAGGYNPILSSLSESVSILWLDHANMYVLHNYVIKKINLNNNIITSIAGNGTSGNAGDGGLALNASINPNITVALDHNGDLYVNDVNSNYVRKINISNGIISSFLTPANSPLIANLAGMCIDNQNNLLIAVPFSHVVLKANLTTSVVSAYAGYGGNGNAGNGGLATNGTLGAPWDVKIKSNGDVFIMDSNYDEIRKVNTSGIISSFYYGSYNVARNLNIDLQGNVYVSDSQNNFIQKINSTGSSIASYGNRFKNYSGNGGNALESDVNLPKAIHSDKHGNLYFIDQQYGGSNLGLCIRKIDKTTNIISTVAGSGSWGFSGDGGLAKNANFGGISDFAIDTTGNIFIADYDNRRIRKVNYSNGIVTTIAGINGNQYSGDGGLAINAGILNIKKIATDLSGNVYIEYDINSQTSTIRKIDINTGIIDLVVGLGPSYADNVLGTNTAIKVQDMVFDSNNNLIITDDFFNRVRKFNASSGVITTIAGNGTNTYIGNNVPPLNASFFNINSVRLDDHDNVYISGGGMIRRIDSAMTNISDYILTNGNSQFYNGVAASDCNCLNINSFEFDIIKNEMFFSSGNLYKLNTTNCNALNTPTLTLNVSNQCESMTAIVVSTNANYYYWLNSPNYSNSYTTNINGTYTVVVSNSLGCAASATVSNFYNNCVWPGDANSDGIANNLDVLELALHYNQTGAIRSSVGNMWQPYTATNWTGTITNGKNLNHSDCNGDGMINRSDTLAIYNNYGLMHILRTAQTATVNSQLSIVPDQPMVTKGMWGTASVYLGDATSPINSINGIAYTIDFDNTLIEPNSIYIEYQNSFIDASQNLHFRKLDFANGKIFTATTHTINNNVNGFGKIATLHYQIKSSLATDEVLNIGLIQANQSNAAGLITPLTSGTGTLLAVGASVGVNEVLNSNNISVSPNPTNGILNITFSTTPQNTKIEVYNSIGALVLTETLSNKNNTINTSQLSNGMYVIKVLENNRITTVQKIVKQ